MSEGTGNDRPNGKDRNYGKAGRLINAIESALTRSVFTEAIGIKNAGQIVGHFRGTSGGERGFLYSGGTYNPIVAAGALVTQAPGINNSGQVVGTFYAWHPGTQCPHGILTRIVHQRV